jgi:helix-turn-helix protein
VAIGRLYTSQEYANLTRRTKRAVERERLRGDGPEFIRANGKVLYSESAIEAWLQARTARSTTEEQQRAAG